MPNNNLYTVTFKSLFLSTISISIFHYQSLLRLSTSLSLSLLSLSLSLYTLQLYLCRDSLSGLVLSMTTLCPCLRDLAHISTHFFQVPSVSLKTSKIRKNYPPSINFPRLMTKWCVFPYPINMYISFRSQVVFGKE